MVSLCDYRPVIDHLFQLAVVAALVGIAIVLSKGLNKMADDQKTQLDALISTIKTGISGLADTLTTTAADLQAAVRDFTAKIAAIPNAPDLSSELSDLGAIADAVVGVKTKVVDIDTAIKTADPGPTEPPPPVEPVEPPV